MKPKFKIGDSVYILRMSYSSFNNFPTQIDGRGEIIKIIIHSNKIQYALELRGSINDGLIFNETDLFINLEDAKKEYLKRANSYIENFT